MITPSKSYLSFSGAIIMLIPLLFACRAEPILLPGPTSINVEATVPDLIYSNIKTVYLDASRTLSLSGRRTLFFDWKCTSFPASSGMPLIIDSEKPKARIDNPVIGQYIFRLTVKDNLGNIAVSNFTMDVLEDTLAGKKPKAIAGPDQQINAPNHTIILNAFETYSVNPGNRSLFLKWTVLEKPAGNNHVEISNFTEAVTNVNGLTEGVYKFQLEVKNDIGLSGFDTVEIKVFSDPLKGTVRVFDDVLWQNVSGPFEDNVVINIKDADIFLQRFPGNMEVRVWDKDKNNWSEPNSFEWWSENGSIIIYYPWPVSDNYEDYYKMVGVKTRVQVKIL